MVTKWGIPAANVWTWAEMRGYRRGEDATFGEVAQGFLPSGGGWTDAPSQRLLTRAKCPKSSSLFGAVLRIRLLTEATPKEVRP